MDRIYAILLDYLFNSFQLYMCRILTCFKLNPFEYLNLPFDSTPEEIKKQYRKVFFSGCVVFFILSIMREAYGALRCLIKIMFFSCR